MGPVDWTMSLWWCCMSLNRLPWCTCATVTWMVWERGSSWFHVSCHHHLIISLKPHFSCTCLLLWSTYCIASAWVWFFPFFLSWPSWQFGFVFSGKYWLFSVSVLHCYILFYCRCIEHSPQHNRNTWISWKIVLPYLVHGWLPSSFWSSV